MRAKRPVPTSSSLVVVVLALISGCSPDEPNVVAVPPEAPAPSGSGANTLSELLNAVDAQRTVQAQCEELARLEAFLVEDRQRYTEQHPDIIRQRQEIARLRDTVPTDEVCAKAGVQIDAEGVNR